MRERCEQNGHEENFVVLTYIVEKNAFDGYDYAGGLVWMEPLVAGLRGNWTIGLQS